MTHLIQLFRHEGLWMSKDSDPKVREIFGTDVLPTPFASSVSSESVLKEIKKLNPDRNVVLRNETIHCLDSI